MIYSVIWQQHKKKKKKEEEEEEEKHTILSYVDPYKATSDQYVFSWPSVEIQAGQSHSLKAEVSGKPIKAFISQITQKCFMNVTNLLDNKQVQHIFWFTNFSQLTSN